MSSERENIVTCKYKIKPKEYYNEGKIYQNKILGILKICVFYCMASFVLKSTISKY